MNYSEAKKLLSGKLLFGHEEQIKAVYHIDAVERCVESIMACPNLHAIEEKCYECMGTGQHECECGNEHECEACDGEGYEMTSGIRFCQCVAEFSWQISSDARDIIAKESVNNQKITLPYTPYLDWVRTREKVQ